MLIKCPECGMQVSDKSNQCIHCGYPLDGTSQNKECSIINGKEYDFSNIIEKIKASEIPAVGCRIIRDFINPQIPLKDAKTIYDIIISTGHTPSEYNCESIPIVESNQPHCPFCNSTNIHKISGTERAVSVVGLGIFSKKINKSFKCNNCGGTF